MPRSLTARAVLAAALLTSAAACGGDAADGGPVVERVEHTAPPGAQFPHLARDASGRLAMSFTVVDAAGPPQVALAIRGTDGTWNAPRVVASDSALFVNWADFPSIRAASDGAWWMHWLRRRGPGKVDYDVLVARSADDGATWSRPLRPHGDVPAEHGFVALLPRDEAGMTVAFLDGSASATPGGATHVVLASLDAATDLVVGTTLDDRTCDCCQVAAATTTFGPVVVYRDRSPDEIRDIAIVRRTANGWTPPALVHRDDWHIEGCPVNGPAVDANGNRVVVAWFTAARDTAKVQVAFSDDGGASFGAVVRADEGMPVGRAGVRFLPDGEALVTWLERTGTSDSAGNPLAAVKARRIAPGGAGPSLTLGETAAGRASGFPRLAGIGDTTYVAWTRVTTGEGPAVELAAVRMGPAKR